jgi:peptidoglycan/LPS O-acetylase OafA/YrhL
MALTQGRRDAAPSSVTTAVLKRHLPALDGIRALAIGGVMAFHLGLGWASGGFLGVDLFFVLSGFLITSLLVEEWLTTARIKLLAFWGRRARRLLPALILVVIAVLVYTVVRGRSAHTVGAGAGLSRLRGDALATLFYFQNWHDVFSRPELTPFSHTWSLSIEEQFYLVWPFVMLALLLLFSARWRRVGLGLCVVGSLASAANMALASHSNALDAVYFQTGARAFDILAGAAIAMLAVGLPQPGRRARTALHVAGPVALACLLGFWFTAHIDTLMYRGGFVLCAALAAVVIADARLVDPGPLGRALSIGPVRWVGVISYGLYLWHWPVFLYVQQLATSFSPVAQHFLDVGLTVGLATLSYYLVERPIRRLRFSSVTRFAAAPVALGVGALLVVVGTTPSVAAPLTAWSGGGLDPGRPPALGGVGGITGAEGPALTSALRSLGHRPLRLALTGDGLMTGAQLGVVSALKGEGRVKVFLRASANGSVDTPAHLATTVARITAVHPDVVVANWSFNGADARSQDAIQTLVHQAVGALLSPTTGVDGLILLQTPAAVDSRPGSGSQAQMTDGVNAAFAQVANAFAGRVLYLPVASSLAVDGHFGFWAPATGSPHANRRAWVRVRSAEGVYLCPAGITRYAAAVVEDLSTVLPLQKPTTDWWSNYVIAIGSLNRWGGAVAVSCPADHPAA